MGHSVTSVRQCTSTSLGEICCTLWRLRTHW